MTNVVVLYCVWLTWTTGPYWLRSVGSDTVSYYECPLTWARHRARLLQDDVGVSVHWRLLLTAELVVHQAAFLPTGAVRHEARHVPEAKTFPASCALPGRTAAEAQQAQHAAQACVYTGIKMSLLKIDPGSASRPCCWKTQHCSRLRCYVLIKLWEASKNNYNEWKSTVNLEGKSEKEQQRTWTCLEITKWRMKWRKEKNRGDPIFSCLSLFNRLKK